MSLDLKLVGSCGGGVVGGSVGGAWWWSVVVGLGGEGLAVYLKIVFSKVVESNSLDPNMYVIDQKTNMCNTSS